MRKQRAALALMLTVLTLTSAARADTVTLTFGGDCVLGTREEWQQSDNRFGQAVEAQGLYYPFSGLAELFTQDDLTMVNLECVLQDGSEGHDSKKQHTFRGKPEYAAMLPAASVELVNVANNHFIDYRAAGRKSTLAALDAAGVGYCGFKELYVLTVGERKIGFGGCRETTFLQSKPTVYRDIQKLKKLGCDAIVYSCHWGKEYSETHNKTQERMAQYAINAGADVVVGTHPHVVQGVEARERSKGGGKALVLYSLGNLVFGGTHDMKTFDGALARVTLYFDGKAYEGASVTLLPVLTSSQAPENDFHPALAKGKDYARIIDQIARDSEIEITDEMWFPAK